MIYSHKKSKEMIKQGYIFKIKIIGRTKQDLT